MFFVTFEKKGFLLYTVVPMREKITAKQATGISCDGSVWRLISLALEKENVILKRNERLEAEEMSVKPLYISPEDLVITALPSSLHLLRPLHLKLTKEKDIDAALPFQAEPLFPYPTDVALLDRVILESQNGATKLTLLSARKESVKQEIETLHAFEIDAEVITSESVALAFFADLVSEGTGPQIVLHVGTRETICALVEKQKPLNCYTLSFGSENLSEIDPEWEKIDLTNDERFTTIASLLRQQITRVLFALAKQSNTRMDSLLLTGLAKGTKLGDFLLPSFKQKMVVPKPTLDLDPEALQENALPIGLALCGLMTAPYQVNFRQGDLAHANPFKRIKKTLVLYLVSSFSLAAAIYLAGDAYIDWKERSLIQKEYPKILSHVGKTHEQIEEQFRKKRGKGDERGYPPPLDSLSEADILVRLEMLNKESASTPDSYPLKPETPLVSEVLAYLSTHPVLSSKDEGGEEITIEKFSYTMIKRPEQTKKKEKYQIKVELELSSTSPKLAREFHDSLIAPNEIVDPKEEIKWSSSKSLYKTSFCLKDKTIYTTL